MSKCKIITPAQAAEEYYALLSARDSLIDFTRYTKPGYVVDPAHRMIAEHLEKLESGEIQRLMIFAPRGMVNLSFLLGDFLLDT